MVCSLDDGKTQVGVVGRTHLMISGFPPRSAMKSLTSSMLGYSSRPVCAASCVELKFCPVLVFCRLTVAGCTRVLVGAGCQGTGWVKQWLISVESELACNVLILNVQVPRYLGA